MASNQEQNKKTVIYDGECHICISVKEKAHKRLKSDSIKFTPSQEYITNETNHNIDQSILQKSLVFINDGTVYTGIDAVIGILLQMKGIWKFAGYALSLPVIKQISGVGYKAFAKYRRTVRWVMEW